MWLFDWTAVTTRRRRADNIQERIDNALDRVESGITRTLQPQTHHINNTPQYSYYTVHCLYLLLIGVLFGTIQQKLQQDVLCSMVTIALYTVIVQLRPINRALQPYMYMVLLLLYLCTYAVSNLVYNTINNAQYKPVTAWK